MKLISNIILAVVILATIINMIDLPWELRFTDVKNNYLVVMVLAVMLPISAFIFSVCRDSRSSKVAGVIISLCLVVPCYIVFIFASSDYENIRAKGVDYSFEEIDRLIVNDSSYVLYRTNGGATTSFGLVLRLEKKLGFGLNAVNVIFSKYKASESTLELTDSNSMIMQIQPYDNKGEVEIVLLNM
ncbi:hypothetical protein [Pseudoalteromonas rubra]|uniref:hypothetical protein n=1 Tax=Pseudoalteromonas rubra TaxID=43658 RepID=UPI000F784EB6|nr:hypothetical protein [Pseudoalteromonas rubra]